MIEGTEIVLVQFRLRGTPELPEYIRKIAPETSSDRQARRAMQDAKPLLKRNGVVPSGVITKLEESRLTLVDAKAQVRVNLANKECTLVTFTFGKNPNENMSADAHKRRLSELKGLLFKRWGDGQVFEFPRRESMRIMHFANEVESAPHFVIHKDDEAEQVGFVLTRSPKRRLS